MPEGIDISSAVSWVSGTATRSVRVSRCPAESRLTSSASAVNASKSVRVCHGGAIAGVNACTNGCMSVLDRSCFSYQVAAGSTTSANSVVEVIRKSRASSRSSLPSGACSRHRTSRGRRPAGASCGPQRALRAEQVAQEVLVALAGGAEQVGPPHRQHPGEVLRRVGVLRGEPQPAGRELVGDERRGRPPGAPRSRPRGRAGSGRTSGRTASSRAAPTGPARPRSSSRRSRAGRSARRTRRPGTGRSATARWRGTSTRFRSSSGAAGSSRCAVAMTPCPVSGRTFSCPT